jgi:mRNA-degrading endonuclease RelE of RelBE toxin-antitoxin system
VNYQVNYTDSFISSFKELKRLHYRKDAEARVQLEERVGRFVGLIEYQPVPPIELARRYDESIKEIHKQQYNSKEYLDHWAFYKLYFVCPNLLGTASMGRLMYVIDENQKTVYFLLIYTHQQYPTRPDDAVMNDAFKALKQKHY